jgi:hypothetical protein
MLTSGEIEVIHIIWQGPLKPSEASKMNRHIDYGGYQIYGTHETSGPDTLLYVGQADGGTFKWRIDAHQEEWGRWNARQITVYLGRLAGSDPITDEGWGRLIDRAEAVLIHKIGVPYNSARIKSLKYRQHPIMVVNYGHRHRLPECITTITEFDNEETLKIFGSSDLGSVRPTPVPETSSEKFG